MKLTWGAKVSSEFVDKILEIGRRFGWGIALINALMAVIAFESARTFRPDIKNLVGSGAVGLIQFTTAGLAHLNQVRAGKGLSRLSLDDLAAMTAVDQLEQVALYFEPYASRIKTLSDVYMAVLAPSAVGDPENTPLYSEGLRYDLNSKLDLDGDHIITKAEASSFIVSRLSQGLQYGYYSEVELGPDPAEVLRDAIALLKQGLAKLEEVA